VVGLLYRTQNDPKRTATIDANTYKKYTYIDLFCSTIISGWNREAPDL